MDLIIYIVFDIFNYIIIFIFNEVTCVIVFKIDNKKNKIFINHFT